MTSNYRYILSRNITEISNRVLLVCMLNPSTADDEKNDPTISRLCSLTKNAGFDRLLVLNLLGVRATNPKDIWLHEDPVGIENWKTWDSVLKELIPGRDRISIAWGRAPICRYYLQRFIPILVTAAHHLKVWKEPLMTWVENLDGSPRHPLYISNNTKLQPYDFQSYINTLLSKNI
jgi:hypothetical protein